MTTEEMLTKLGEGVDAQTKRIGEMRAEMEKEIKAREEAGKEVDSLKERAEKFEAMVKEVRDANDTLMRQVKGGAGDERKRLDPTYYNPARGRRFPNQRAAADFAYVVGAGLYRDSECMAKCEERGIPVTYLKSDGRAIDVLKTRDLQVGVDSEGGYAVTPDAMMIIWDVADEFGMYADALQVPMTSLERTILLPEDGIDMYFLDELEAATKSGLTFAKAVLKAKKVGGYAVWSGEFAEDVAAFTGEQLVQLFGRALARKIDVCLFAGDGTSQYGGIVGVLHNADTPLVPMPAGKTSMLNATHSDFLSLKYGVPARIRKLGEECAFYINPDAFYIMEDFKDGVGRPLLTSSPANPTERRLWGHMVKEIHSYPDLSADAAGVPWASFGALRRAYCVGIRRALRIRRASELFALQDAEAIIAFARFDVQAFAAHNVATLVTAEA